MPQGRAHRVKDVDAAATKYTGSGTGGWKVEAGAENRKKTRGLLLQKHKMQRHMILREG
eukprot:CAMPEP_0174338944 /NCGR_PEP_ID=MMETSP0810-20121108/23543_1 /TAXON_ID=73025 ORGANISM="Eutreptiella gymnastica-like, Strain CCMP1594" /NCGR_SAMPLE_ID=MMETSP0810 /ASSEMBLY_ACC=CAM_ASM_000659 /LENGTH=58 /DNA_ID=CAMNT_0015459337 /DNA_START=265 /DNA_END=437 /DNA_ORIENTATION=+